MSKMNRLGNAKNPYQTAAKRVLAVCSAGLLRSPTVANVLYQEFDCNTRAAGIDQEFALIRVDDVLIAWADEIVCVNDEVAAELERQFGDLGARVLVLELPDQYEWNAPELRKAIIEQYAAARARLPA